MLRLIRNRMILIDMIAFVVFGVVLYSIYSVNAWQSNLIWLFIHLISICSVHREQESFWHEHWLFVNLVDFVLAFGLIGNYCFCYPLEKSIEIFDVFKFFLFSLACTPISIWLGSIPDKLQKVTQTYVFRKRLINEGELDSKSYVIHLIIYILIPVFIGISAMCAFNPCIVSYDAHEVIAEAYGLTEVQNYAGILYVLWYRALLWICDSIVFLCLVQVLLFAISMALILIYIEKYNRVKFKIILIVYIVFMILPSNIMMLITLSKDVYYAVFLLLLSYSLLRVYNDSEKIGNYVLLGALLFFTYNIRQSGIVVAIVVCIMGVLLFKKKKPFLITCIISLALSTCFASVLADVTKAEKTPEGMKYIAMYQDMLGVYYAGGDMSEEALELIQQGVGDKIGFADVYTPYWAYYDEYYVDIANVEVFSFMKSYINTFFKNPVLMSKSILCRLDMMWNFRPGVNARETWQWMVDNSGGKWTYLVKERTNNVWTKIVNTYGELSKKYPYKDIVWRVGIWNFGALMSFIYFLKKEKKKLVIFLPFIGYLFSYAVSLGWSHYRYYWADELMVFFLLLETLGMLLNVNDNICKSIKG